jgi:hypothetical protein
VPQTYGRVSRPFTKTWEPSGSEVDVGNVLVKFGSAFGSGIALIAAFLLGVGPLIPPAPLPADAPEAMFSAERAMAHVRVIAAAPHPAGSARQSEVAAYLQQQLGAIGLTPSVQESRVSLTRKGFPPEILLRNIITTIPGTQPSKAVLLAAHYDSVPGSPGASDNAAAVATLLETARALRAGSRVANDVVLLFSDGEEAGLLGARAFMASHPLAPAVGVVINFDARGRGGPVVMFETAGPNLAFAQELSRSAPYPIATSLSEDVYRRMPNTTDFTEFRRRGLTGVNFAFFAEPRYYHNANDRIEHLDPRTLQHEGTYALAMSSALGNRRLPLAAGGRGVYFNVGRALLLAYPAAWALPLAVLVVLLLAAALAAGLIARRLTLRGLAIGTLAALAAIIVSGLIGFSAERFLARPIGARSGGIAIGLLYFAIVCGLVMLAVSLVYRLARRRATPADLLVPVHACWTLFALALTLVAPGASYLFLWPAAAGVLAVLVLLVLRRRQPERAPESAPESALGAAARAWLAIPALPAVLLLTPALGLIYFAIGPSIVTSVVAVSVALVTALVAPTGTFAIARQPRLERATTPAAVTVMPNAASTLATKDEIAS